MQKIFTARYRYRQVGIIGPIDYSVDLTAPSLKEAKRIAKGWEGRDDRMRWYMGVERKSGPVTETTTGPRAESGPVGTE